MTPVGASALVGDCGRLRSVARSCELLREHKVLTIRGNHERWFLGGAMRDLPDATLLDDVPLSSREWLGALPPVLEFSTPLGGLLLCHGLGTWRTESLVASDAKSRTVRSG